MSVCGTGSIRVKLSGFSREYGYLHYQLPPKGMPYFRVSSHLVDLPARVCDYALQRGYPSPRGSVTAPSPHRPMRKSRNLDRVSHRTRRSAYPYDPTHQGMIDIARETLVLWRTGIPPVLSLLIPTFAFPEAPPDVTDRLRRRRNAPLPILSLMLSRAFGVCLIPDYYPRPVSRLVSCYALFE